MSSNRNSSSPKPFTPGYSQPASSRFAASNGDNDIPGSASRPPFLKPQSMNMHAAFQLVSDTSTTDNTVRQQSASFSGPVGTASAPASSSKQRGATVDGVEPERVKVLVRVRPCLREEENPGALTFSARTDGSSRMTLFRPDAPITQSEYNFDKVLGPEASQHDVYACGVKDVVADVLQGYNGTVMAYGQTGAGKTFTLGNTDIASIGMIPRAVAEIFNKASEDSFHTYSVTMSYMQIYCELIQDLLNPTSENLNIREDNNNGVFVAGLSEVVVVGLQECLHYMEMGERNRAFAFTHLNAHSSRSHAVVMLTVVKSRKYHTAQEMAEAKRAEKDGISTQKVKVGKLYLVDLAGSERLKKSKSVGQRAHEAKAINLSLSTLGMCISARAMDHAHVPFRDSKLTRLLQESLGGNAKTVLLVCVSDVKEHADETLQSLQFAARAMCVKNKPVVNERLNYKELHAELMSQMDTTSDKSNVLEAVLVRSEEERAALQAAMEEEKSAFGAIMDALRCEAEIEKVAAKAAQAEAEAAKAASLAAMVAHQAVVTMHTERMGAVEQARSRMEGRIMTLQSERTQLIEAHRSEVAALGAAAIESKRVVASIIHEGKEAAAASLQDSRDAAAAQAVASQLQLQEILALRLQLQASQGRLQATQGQLEESQATAQQVSQAYATSTQTGVALTSQHASIASSLAQLQSAMVALLAPPPTLPAPPALPSVQQPILRSIRRPHNQQPVDPTNHEPAVNNGASQPDSTRPRLPLLTGGAFGSFAVATAEDPVNHTVNASASEAAVSSQSLARDGSFGSTSAAVAATLTGLGIPLYANPALVLPDTPVHHNLPPLHHTLSPMMHGAAAAIAAASAATDAAALNSEDTENSSEQEPTTPTHPHSQDLDESPSGHSRARRIASSLAKMKQSLNPAFDAAEHAQGSGNGQLGAQVHTPGMNTLAEEGGVAEVENVAASGATRVGRTTIARDEGSGSGEGSSFGTFHGNGVGIGGVGNLFSIISSRLMSLQSIVETSVQMKEGSESELMQQACEALRLHRVIVDLQLGMSQAQLTLSAADARADGVESQLAVSHAELLQKRADMMENEETLDAYRSTLISRELVISTQTDDMQGQEERLVEKAVELLALEGRLGERREEIQTLEASLLTLGERLAAERSLRAQLQIRMSGHLSMSEEAAMKRGRESAVRLIQRTFRCWQTRMLHKRMQKEREDREESQAALGLMEQASVRAGQMQAAAAGAQLVQESMVLVRSGLGSLLAAFLLPKKDLEARATLTRALKQLSPLSSPAPFSHLPTTRQIYTQPATARTPNTQQLNTATPPAKIQGTASSPNPGTNAPLRVPAKLASQAVANTPTPVASRAVASPPNTTGSNGTVPPTQRAPFSAYATARREALTAAEPAPPSNNPSEAQLHDQDSLGSAAGGSSGRRSRASSVHFTPTTTGAAAAAVNSTATAVPEAIIPPSKATTPFASDTAGPAAVSSRTKPVPSSITTTTLPSMLSRSSSTGQRSSRSSPVAEPGSPGRSQSLSTNVVMSAGSGPLGAIPRHVLMPSPPQAEDSGFTVSEVSSRAASGVLLQGHGPV